MAPLRLCSFQTVQQDVPGQWQLWPDVLRPWLQPVHGEAGGALPLQVPLVLLRHLQEVRAHRGEIRLQMSPGSTEAQDEPKHYHTKKLTFALSFSMCISTGSGLFLCQYPFSIQSPNCHLGFSAFCFTDLGVAAVPVYVKTAVLLGISFFLLMIMSPPERDVESLYFIIYLIKRNNIGFYAGGEAFSSPFTRHNCLASLHGKGLHSKGSAGYFSLGTITALFLCSNGQQGEEEHKGNFKYFQSWNIFVVVVLDSHHASWVDLHVDWEKSITDFVEWCLISLSLTCSSKYILFFRAYELNSWIL